MNHHRQVEAAEGTPFQHLDLASAAFLGGRAEHFYGHVEVVGNARECEAGAHRDRRDDVVTACVTETRQRVVLGAQPHPHGPGSGSGVERGLETEVRLGDGEPAVAQPAAHPPDRLVFFPSCFGVGVQLLRQGDQAGKCFLHRRPGPSLQVIRHPEPRMTAPNQAVVLAACNPRPAASTPPTLPPDVRWDRPAPSRPAGRSRATRHPKR